MIWLLLWMVLYLFDYVAIHLGECNNIGFEFKSILMYLISMVCSVNSFFL